MPSTKGLMFPEGQPGFKEEPVVNIKTPFSPQRW